jgi:diaminohydroxyphosphoribosylaminopyrimidine deaminase / 5-amino-6-(5-phosphoribosylamino)uracil reductase
MFSDFDRFAMTRALELAARGLETTDPNPRVGCVIARRDRVIGEGWHRKAGEAHAEVAALATVKEDPEGTTVYVTLEPCSHFGRTPPCSDALIAARVARVVYAVADPDPRVSGKGAEALQSAGIRVESGLMEAEAVELNLGFLQRMQYGRPWVRLKLAMSLDGRTALANGQSQWITSEASRTDVQHWRARSSAILTGAGTILTDDPRLDVRLPPIEGEESRRQPIRVVLDSQLRTPPGARIFTTGGEVVILTSGTPDMTRVAALEERGAQIEAMPLDEGRVDLAAALQRLAEREVNEVLVEAGPTLAGQLLRRQLIDEMLLYIAPKLLGPQARGLIEMQRLDYLEHAPEFALEGVKKLGDDMCVRLRPRD